MAGLGWRKFAAGEVLTATNMQGYGIDQSIMSFAGTAARGSAIGTAVAQGMTSFQQDTGMVETYFNTFGTATNPGGRDAAGWYATRKTDGLVPIKVPVVNGDGTITTTALGKINFSGSTYIRMNSIFSSTYTNYRLVINLTGGVSTSTDLAYRYSAAGTDGTNTYLSAGWGIQSNNTSGSYAATSQSRGYISDIYGASQNLFSSMIDISSPFATLNTHLKAVSSGTRNTGNPGILIMGGFLNDTVSYDGMIIYPLAGTFTGSISVYGYNEK
jgi:hypothetical protein